MNLLKWLFCVKGQVFRWRSVRLRLHYAWGMRASVGKQSGCTTTTTTTTTTRVLTLSNSSKSGVWLPMWLGSKSKGHPCGWFTWWNMVLNLYVQLHIRWPPGTFIWRNATTTTMPVVGLASKIKNDILLNDWIAVVNQWMSDLIECNDVQIINSWRSQMNFTRVIEIGCLYI